MKLVLFVFLLALLGCAAARDTAPPDTLVPLVDPAPNLDPVSTWPYPPNYGTGICARWYTTAIDAGWTDQEWPTLNRIMHAESQCVATARNPVTVAGYGNARGLMQILDELWAPECGITVDELYVPLLNLRCARHVWELQGWSAWSTF